MIKKQSNVLVLDTETTGNFNCPLVYDFGYIIKDKNFNEIVRRNWLVKEIWETEFLMNSAYYISKKPLYENMVANEEIEVLPLREIIKIWIKDMQQYKVKTVAAYNISFDDRALTKTIGLCGSDLLEKLNKVLDSRNKLCLQNLAVDSIVQLPEYEQFCLKHDLFTNSGRCSMKAENVYRYVIQDAEFEESHTALDDAKIEFEIMEYICNNCNGRLNYGIFYNTWQKVGVVKK